MGVNGGGGQFAGSQLGDSRVWQQRVDRDLVWSGELLTGGENDSVWWIGGDRVDLCADQDTTQKGRTVLEGQLTK